jgi:hypothetical protein
MWKTSLPAIMPVPVILNKENPSYRWINDPQRGLIVKEVFETGYIIPFLPQLQQLLTIKVVYASVIASFEKNSSGGEC